MYNLRSVKLNCFKYMIWHFDKLIQIVVIQSRCKNFSVIPRGSFCALCIHSHPSLPLEIHWFAVIIG